MTIKFEPHKCSEHGGHFLSDGRCQTLHVLDDIMAHRAEQFKRYGTNDEIPDGTGSHVPWLGPFWWLRNRVPNAATIEEEFRSDYEDFKEETGTVTWMHLVREEVAEAFKENDPERLREELVQVAALAVSWIEKLDARAALGLPAPELAEAPC